MKITISRKARRFVSIFTIIFHIYIFSNIGIHYFEQKNKIQEREKTELLREQEIEKLKDSLKNVVIIP